MPLNTEAMVRRRTLLGMSQVDLAIVAGISSSTLAKIENYTVANKGGNTGIDVVMRIASALQMDIRDLLIQPVGNKYERAVLFAAHQVAPSAAPKIHDRSRSIRAQGYRKLSGLSAVKDMFPIIEPEPDIAHDEHDRPDADNGVGGDSRQTFLRDPSSE
jgi:transcriptional regulator with XRE-family HTH domain